MYTSEIITPHPLKAGEIEPTTIEDRLKDVPAVQNLADLSGSDYEQQKIEAALEISKITADALWYPVVKGNRNDFREMQIPPVLTAALLTGENQVADCFGYSIVTSESLDALGIEHFIGYANTHAFTLIPYEQTDMMLVDSLSPKFNQLVSGAAWQGNRKSFELERVKHQINTHGRAATLLDGRLLARQTGKQADELAMSHPWIKVAASNKLDTYNVVSTDPNVETNKVNAPYKLVTSIFEADKGRQMLTTYMDFKNAMAVGNLTAAEVLFNRLDGTYPELDARQAHQEVTELAMRLCVVDPRSAEHVTEQYFSRNFSLSEDSRIPESKARLLTRIARATKSKQTALKAAAAYEEARQRPGAFTEKIEGRLAKLHHFIGELSVTSELS